MAALLAGMAVEMLAMLAASAIQGQVVAVYNREAHEVCGDRHQEQGAAEGGGTPSPRTHSLQQTVKTLELLNKRAPLSSGYWAAE